MEQGEGSNVANVGEQGGSLIRTRRDKPRKKGAGVPLLPLRDEQGREVDFECKQLEKRGA